MNFTRSELEMLYQYAAPTKEETLAGLKEIVPVLERKDDLLSKVIVENAIRKLENWRSRSAAGLLRITGPPLSKSGIILSARGLPPPNPGRGSRFCRGMTWQAWSGSCRKQGTW